MTAAVVALLVLAFVLWRRPNERGRWRTRGGPGYERDPYRWRTRGRRRS